MLDGLILFVALMSGGLLICGILGIIADCFSSCAWVNEAFERMIK